MIPRLIQQTRNMLTVLRDWNAYFVFMAQPYQKHTVARLEHLDSLDLDIRGRRVLEVGAGIGEHTLFYLHRACQVTSTDGRSELVRFIRNRLGIPAHVLDVETDIGKLTRLGKFDILHCYGLLYHISNAAEFIAHASLAADRMFLETCVTFGHENALHTFAEDPKKIWEATSGRGSCRPDPGSSRSSGSTTSTSTARGRSRSMSSFPPAGKKTQSLLQAGPG